MTVKHRLLNIFVVKVFVNTIIAVSFEFTMVPEFLKIILVDNAQIITNKKSFKFLLLLVLIGLRIVWPSVIF